MTRALVLVAAVFLLLLVLYPSFDNELVSDDWVFVYQALTAQGLGDVFARVPADWFSRPMLWLLSYVITGLFGTDPLPFRLCASLVHSANALLVGLLAWRLGGLGSRRQTPELPWNRRAVLALGASGLFFVYALSHEVLYWFAATPEALALLARLSVLWIVLGGLGLRALGRRQLVWRMVSVAVVSLVAVASKESAVVLPVELGLLWVVACWSAARRRGAWSGDQGKAVLPLLLTATAVIASWWFWYSAGGVTRAGLTILELGPEAWILRLGQTGWRAVALGFLPVRPVMLVLLLVAGVMLFLQALWCKRPVVVFALPWLALCLLPYVGITSVAERAAAVPVLERTIGIAEDRYYYGAGAAMAVLTAAIAVWLGEAVGRCRLADALRRRLAWAPVLALVVLGSVHALHLRAFEAEWDHAGKILADVRQELGEKLEMPIRPGEVICVDRRPDNYRGRFILRSGIKEMILLAAGHEGFEVLVPPYANPLACTRRLLLESGMLEKGGIASHPPPVATPCERSSARTRTAPRARRRFSGSHARYSGMVVAPDGML